MVLASGMDEEFILVFEGELVKITDAIHPSTYRDYVSFGKNGRNILYKWL